MCCVYDAQLSSGSRPHANLMMWRDESREDLPAYYNLSKIGWTNHGWYDFIIEYVMVEISAASWGHVSSVSCYA